MTILEMLVAASAIVGIVGFVLKIWDRMPLWRKKLRHCVKKAAERFEVEDERRQRIRRAAEKQADGWIRDKKYSVQTWFANNGSEYSWKEKELILSVYRRKGFNIVAKDRYNDSGQVISTDYYFSYNQK